MKWALPSSLPVPAAGALIGIAWLAGCSRPNTETAPREGVYAAPVISNGFATQVRITPQTTWVSFQDPAEQAFTIDVPRGWTVKGGLYRLGFFDYRPMIDITSPDGKVNVRYGDAGVPPYSLPDRQHPKEGAQIVMDAQAQMTVAGYRSGDAYARSYAQSRFSGDCQHPVAGPEQAGLSSFKAASVPQGDISEESEGHASFRCDGKNGPIDVFVYARTLRHKGTAIWTVTPVVSFLSPQDQRQIVWEQAARFAQSFKINPAWVQHQSEMDRQGVEYARALAEGKMRAFSQQVQQFHARMQAMSAQVAGFEGRMNAQAAQVQGFDDALVGITRTIDPLTGDQRQVWTGQSNQYWTNGKGQVISSPTAPGPDFRPLQTTSH
jgi:hypothetical protein